MEHTVEFYRHVVTYEKGVEVSASDAFEFLKTNFESGAPDPHCHVWDDATFHSQFAYLPDAGLLGDLALTGFDSTPEWFNKSTANFKRQVQD